SDWLPEKCVEPRPVAAAQRQLGAVPEMHDAVAVEAGLQRLDAPDVHERGSVDADEPGRVEFRLDLVQALPEQVSLGADVKSHILAAGLDPIDVLGPHRDDATPLADEEEVHVRPSGPD